jgi:hypothetical protein
MTDKTADPRPMDADIDPIAYFEKLRAANHQRAFKETHPDYYVKRKAYDAQRKGRSGRRFADKSHTGGNFVAIDAEGMDLEEPPYRLAKDGSRIYYANADAAKADKKNENYQDHRTVLWMAGGTNGIDNETIVNLNGFKSEEIMSYLCNLPQHFDNAIKQYSGAATMAKPKFISFGFGYDVAQIVKDMPYEKRYELNAGKAYSNRNDGLPGDLMHYPVLYKGFALTCIPGKMVTIFRLKDPANPFYYDGKRVKHVSYSQRICIYDTFGFFQMAFTGALEGFPNALNKEEYDLVVANKAKRGRFKPEDIEEITRYTSLELKGLVNMLDTIRASLRTAIEGKPIELSKWYGAGAIANAALKLFLGKDGTAHLGNMGQYNVAQWEDPNHYCNWVKRAYFGARIDLVKQGNHTGALYEYDIASAYPAIAAEIPTMKDGGWELVENPTREDVFNASALSMFEVKTHNYSEDLPSYALPFRTKSGAIMFPPIVWGYYMRDHVIAAYKHFGTFIAADALQNYSHYDKGPEIEIVRAWIFHPTSDFKPLGFVRDMFGYRTMIVKLNKKDSRGQVIKLLINAIYGKMAQRKGHKGKPSKYASLWFAAAITAGTQRKLTEAALTKPHAIVAFATDGIYSTEPLDVDLPVEKTLGEWEMQKGDKGAFIQSGVYTVHLLDKNDKPEIKANSRGFRPDNTEKKDNETHKEVLDRTLRETIPAAWASGKEAYSFDYKQYMTVGLSVQHRKFDTTIGCWKNAPRDLRLNTMSNKRILPGEAKKEAAKRSGKEFPLTQKEVKLRLARAKKLISLPVRPLMPWEYALSAASDIDWIDDKTRLERQEAEDLDNVAAGLT